MDRVFTSRAAYAQDRAGSSPWITYRNVRSHRRREARDAPAGIRDPTSFCRSQQGLANRTCIVAAEGIPPGRVLPVRIRAPRIVRALSRDRDPRATAGGCTAGRRHGSGAWRWKCADAGVVTGARPDRVVSGPCPGAAGSLRLRRQAGANCHVARLHDQRLPGMRTRAHVGQRRTALTVNENGIRILTPGDDASSQADGGDFAAFDRKGFDIGAIVPLTSKTACLRVSIPTRWSQAACRRRRRPRGRRRPPR